MSGGIRKRFVTDPDGARWIVGRHWLARRPRYRGFRFGRDPYEPSYEPPAPRRTARPPIRKPRSGKLQPPAPNPYRDNPDLSDRPRGRGGGWWIFSGRPWGGGGSVRTGGSSSGSAGGGFLGRSSSGGGFRFGGSGGGSRSRGGGGRGKSGGGGAGAGIAGVLGALVKVLKFILIALAVIAALLFLIFVGLPALAFFAQYLLFWILVAGTIGYNAVTGRPWIVTVHRPGYEQADHAFRVKGWRRSREVINDIAEALRSGDSPHVALGDEVELVEH